MKPTSEQTRRGVLSCVPLLTEDLLNMRRFFRYQESSDAAVKDPPAGADPSCAYGCVDWYLYPDSETSGRGSGGRPAPGSTTPNSTGKQA